MSIDRRAFRFSLEPLLVRAQWQLNAARDALASAVVATREAREQEGALRQDLLHQAKLVESAGAGGNAGFDIGRRMASLAYLSGLRGKLDELTANAQACERSETACRQTCERAQMDIERLARVKENQWEAFVREQTAQAAREADADWIARTAHLQGRSDMIYEGEHRD